MDISDNSNFCSNCGHHLNVVNFLSKFRACVSKYKNSKHFNTSLNIWLITAFFVSVCFLLVFSSYNESSHYAEDEYNVTPASYDNPTIYLPTTSYVSVETPPSETATISVSGDFSTDLLSISFNDENKITVTLSDSIASEYRHFYWTLTDLHHTFQTTSYFNFTTYIGKTVAKEEPVLTWNAPAAGEYEIKVHCYDIDGNSSSYSGNILYNDYIVKHYLWSYDNRDYSMDIPYMFSEYLQYTPSLGTLNESRSGNDYSKMADFCVVDDTINDIADGLKTLYYKSYGTNASIDQKFADFILAFVNLCYTYPPNSSMPDYYEYGQLDYWAYPMETIYHNMGDCEDTAILCASLFKACGFDSAIVIMPGHAIAAVVLDSFIDSRISVSYRVYPFHLTINDKLYYGCETTLVDNSYGVGYISSLYSSEACEFLQVNIR